MGGIDKAALDVAGVPMLDRVLAAAGPHCARLVVVGPARPTALAGVRFVQEPAPGGGPVPAVAAGLEVIGDQAGVVFVLAADLPLLGAADLGRLLDRLGTAPDVDAVAADHRGAPNALLAAYRAGARVAWRHMSETAVAAGMPA